jgi:MFS family permease
LSSSVSTDRRILFGLMLPAMLMPLLSTMSRVALPVVRDHFALTADVAAWIDVGFTLPFMLFMPIFGRLGDALGPRRLLLVGIAFFALGTCLVLTAESMSRLLTGRAIQGFGLAGMMPLSITLISSLFPPETRGRTMGTWSTVGPTTGFFGPLLAGLLVAAWGWHAAYAPPLLCGMLAFFVVYKIIPARAQVTPLAFLRSFDWGGALLLATSACSLVLYLSSRLITGIAPLHDWRLALVSLSSLLLFFWWEKRHKAPFVAPALFANSTFLRASFCASMRMVAMGGIGFLMPLYLVDIKEIRLAELGGMLMIGAGSMAVVVRVAGALADRWSSRWLVVIGLLGQTGVMLSLWHIEATASLWSVAAAQSAHGLSAGFMLATLHKVVMGSVGEEEMGTAAGLYSMFRFLGAAIGTALSGVLLQQYLDAGLPAVEAYQQAFLVIALFPALGILVALSLRD